MKNSKLRISRPFYDDLYSFDDDNDVLTLSMNGTGIVLLAVLFELPS